MEMYNITEEYKHYLSTNESSSDLINEINEIRYHIDESDHPYDEREYDNWEDYVNDIWGPECGYHDVFDSTIDRFEAEREKIYHMTLTMNFTKYFYLFYESYSKI